MTCFVVHPLELSKRKKSKITPQKPQAARGFLNGSHSEYKWQMMIPFSRMVYSSTIRYWPILEVTYTSCPNTQYCDIWIMYLLIWNEKCLVLSFYSEQGSFMIILAFCVSRSLEAECTNLAQYRCWSGTFSKFAPVCTRGTFGPFCTRFARNELQRTLTSIPG